jgi:hypothetical protein
MSSDFKLVKEEAKFLVSFWCKADEVYEVCVEA